MALTTLKTALLTPMPRASVNSATIVNAGALRSPRAAYRMSCTKVSMELPYGGQARRFRSATCLESRILSSHRVVHHLLERGPVDRLAKLPERPVNLGGRRLLRAPGGKIDIDTAHLDP